MGRQVDVVQEFIRIQSFGHNWWWANGIRVEYFPRINHIAALKQSPRVPVKNERKARIIHRTDHLHVDVQRHFMEIQRQWTGMRIKRSARCCLQKDFTRKMVIPRTWIRKEVVFYSWMEKPQGEWDRVAELMVLKFGESGHPVFRATSPLSPGTLKSRGGGKLSIHFCADEGTIETVFRTIISVSQLSLKCVWRIQILPCRTGRLVLAGQSDPLFVPTSSLMKTPKLSTDDHAQEDLLQKY